MKFAICNELFEGWDFRKTVDFTAGAGYHGIEIAPFTFADSVAEISAGQRREIREIATDAGLTIVGLHWLLVKPEGLSITHPDPAVRDKTIDYLRKLVDFCADIGGKIMVFGSPNQRKILPELTLDDGWKLAADSFRLLGPAAGSRGVTICLEALPPVMTNLLNTNAAVLKMVQEIDHPNIRMMLDVKSMCAESVAIPENIHNCRDYFRHVHANDANMRGPGFGDVDYHPIFEALQEVSFAGFVSVEVFDFTPDPETIAIQSLRYMKQCLP